MAIKVVSQFGGSALGGIVAEEGMITNYGTITRVSGSLCFVGSGTTQSSSIQYDYYLQIASGQAYQQFSWPTGVNCTADGHHSYSAAGNFRFNVHSTSGHTYMRGNGVPTTFAR